MHVTVIGDTADVAKYAVESEVKNDDTALFVLVEYELDYIVHT